jgi:ketosteroid isomerase-like protein
VVPVDLLVGRDHVAAVVDISGQCRGLVLRDRAIQLLAFRDGQIVTRRVYPADQAAFDRFRAP